jgi:hypothetical protein
MTVASQTVLGNPHRVIQSSVQSLKFVLIARASEVTIMFFSCFFIFMFFSVWRLSCRTLGKRQPKLPVMITMTGKLLNVHLTLIHKGAFEREGLKVYMHYRSPHEDNH